MYARNGRPQLPRQTSWLVKLKDFASLLLTKLRNAQPPVRVSLLIVLVLLLVLLFGCATPSQPDQLPKNPQPPQVLAPPSTGTYLQKVETLLEKWRSLVSDTAQM